MKIHKLARKTRNWSITIPSLLQAGDVPLQKKLGYRLQTKDKEFS